MDRRNSLKAIAAAGSVLLPLELLAQARPKNRPFRIGIGTGALQNRFRAAFKAQMGDLGWQEGQDYVIAANSGGPTDPGNFAKEIAWLVGQKLDVLIVSSTAGAVEAHRLTKTLPIVMLASGYPVEAGVANSLARPGKNVTGNSIYAGTGVWGKLLELLRESKPGIKRVGLLWGYVPPAFPAAEVEPAYAELGRSARALGLSTHRKEVPSRDKLAAAVTALAADRPDALFVSGWLTGGEGWSNVAEFASDRKLPTVTDFDVPWTGKGLRPMLIYSANIADLWKQAIIYIDRVLRGTNPAELPIQLPARFELTVNLGTAKAIGLTLPQSILLRADKVIE